MARCRVRVRRADRCGEARAVRRAWRGVYRGRARGRDLVRGQGGAGNMRMDRFTTKSREALADAQGEAERRGNPEIYPEHVMVAVLKQDGGVGPALVQK